MESNNGFHYQLSANITGRSILYENIMLRIYYFIDDIFNLFLHINHMIVAYKYTYYENQTILYAVYIITFI